MKDIEQKKRPCRSSRTENSRTGGGGQRKNAGCTRPRTVRFEIGAPNASLASTVITKKGSNGKYVIEIGSLRWTVRRTK